MLKREWLFSLALPLTVSLTFPTVIPLCCAEKPQVQSSLPESPRTAPLFDFHSNFWVNLHQVLFHEAKLRAGKPDRLLQSAAPLSVVGMSKQDEANWNAAVSFYASYFGTRQQHGDDQLVQINDDLAEQPDNGAHLNQASLPPELVAALRSAAVTYRKYWWPAQNESNENWIAAQKERVQDLGPKLAAAMTRDLHQQWPTAPIRVAVCYYVATLGHANTTLPPHITYSSSDPTHEGVTGFELLFHEASHTFADTMTDTLSAQCRAQNKNCEDLWHTVLFYTSGVELRRLLPASEQAGFTPYAYKYDLYTRGRWANYRPLLETDWQAYLDGKMNFDSTLQDMATGLP